LLVVVLVALGLVWVTRGPRVRASGVHHASVGKAPASWHLEPLTGEPPAIALANLKGKVTLVNFWGTWCPPCREEFPHFVALWEELKDSPNFQMVSVSCEGPEKSVEELRTNTAEYLTASNTDMPTYHDPDGKSRIALMDTIGEQLVYPTTVLVGRDGKILAFWRGYVPGMETEVREVTKQALAAAK
jgi:thiol-disulfide isomerase/thioredoxin